MSPNVDNRVVELDFDNKEFESGTAQSLKSLEALKKGLNLDESARSISNLSKVSKGFSLAGISESVEGVRNRFSTLGIIGITVLQNLTNAAINYGRKMLNSFMTPMKTGFQEYETQMNAIQTVLANTESKGTTLKDVSAALNELNTYADQTIYNFTEMTRNIGTFTAAGVSLETSTAAIKGIANLAAVSGSNSQQASVAMYQLSQALSSGTVKLMDWNSVVNAGMGGQVFQDALKETARVSGIAIDDLIKQHGSFRETLSTGWLSSEVLLDTLKKFTGDLTAEQLKTMGYTEDQIAGILKLGQTANDAATKVKTFTQLQDTLKEAMQSGWTRTWELIIGDFEQAKALFTEISDTLGAMIGASADARNAFVASWAGMGGRTAAIQTLRNVFNGLLSIIAPIKEAFRQIFPPATAGDLFRLTLIVRNLSEKLILTSENADKVKRIFLGLFSVLGIAKDIVVNLVRAFFDLSSEVPISGDGILDFLANIGDFLVGMREGIDVTGIFETAIGRIKEVLATVGRYIDQSKIAFLGWKESIQNTFSELSSKIDLSIFTKFFDRFHVKLTPFQTLLKGIGLILGAVLKGVVALVPGLAKIGGAIFEFVKNLGSSIVKGIENINFSEVFDIINAGLIGTILLAIRNFIKSGSGAVEGIGGIFEGITGVLDGVRGSFEAWQQNLKAKTLMTLAIAIGVLAAALFVLSTIDSKKLTTSLGAMTAMFVQLISAQAAFGKLGGAGPQAMTSLVLMAGALLILSFAIAKLSKLKKENINNALGAIYGLLAGMLIFSKFMSKNKTNLLSAGFGMASVAVSMLLLAQVVKKLGALDPEELMQGLKGVGIMLAEIAVFMRVVDNKGVTKSLGLLAVAGAIFVLANVVKTLGDLDVEVLKKGLASIGAIFGEIAIFTRISGSGKGMITMSVGVAILGASLRLFVDVVKELGSMNPKKLATGLGGMAAALIIIAGAMRAIPKNILLQAAGLYIVAQALSIISNVIMGMSAMTWEEIARGLVTLAGALAIITLSLYAMSGTLAGSFALLVAAGALAVLTPVLATLGAMSLGEIGTALLFLAGVFLVLGLAGLVLTPLVPTLLSLGGALLLLGLGTALVGVGLLAFSTGLLALAAGGSAAALGIVAFVTTLLGLLPVIVNTLIDTLIVFAKGITRAAPEVAKAITALMKGFLQVIIDTSPKIFETLDVLLKGLIQLIRDNIPDFIVAVVELLLTLLQEIANKLPDFLAAGLDILLELMRGIRDNINEVTEVAIDTVTQFIDSVALKLPDIIDSGFNLIVSFIDGMADAIDTNTPRLLEAVGRLAGSIIDGLVTGVTNGVQAVIDAVVRLVRRVLQAAWEAFSSGSPSQEMVDLAETLPEGLVKGLQLYGYRAVNATKKFGEEVMNAMGIVTTGAASLLAEEMDFNPTITPVVDMSNISSAGNLVESIFGTKALNLVPAISSASSIFSGLSIPVISSEKTSKNPEGTTINFNQTNNSPKTLSRIEIYRQTRNQLLQAKGLVS